MIYISIGSNVGNRLHNLQLALKKIAQQGFVISQLTPIIETTAILPEAAPADWNNSYFNMVIGGTTSATPQELLQQLLQIERELGRAERHPRWSPRIIDLDILLFDKIIVNEVNLNIPHPELLKRDFLIHLLALLIPNQKHPLTQQSWLAIAQQCNFQQYPFIRSLVARPALVGIVNVTPDSFSDGGQFFDPQTAMQKALNLYEEGASIVELGAQSTRPNATMISPQEEYQRLNAVLQLLKKSSLLQQNCLGIDSFVPEVILKILDQYPLAWINDVTGELDAQCIAAIAERDCLFVTMHALSVPPRQDKVISTAEDPSDIVYQWAEDKINYLLDCGMQLEKIIIDPGIGFSKTGYQNYALVKTIERLKALDVAICLGHSRKLFINIFNQHEAQDRDIETLAISNLLVQQKVDYLRVHNVAAHQLFFVAQQAAFEFKDNVHAS